MDNFGRFYVKQKRGGGSASTITGDPSSYPTAPPASTHTHFRSVPKVGGSEGGFIGLVVALGVVIIGSCIGVYFLLRYRRHGGRSTRTKSGEVGVEPLGFPRKRGTLFGFRSSNPSRSGWVRAAGEDEDEWDADADADAALRGADGGAIRGPGARHPESVEMNRSAYGAGGFGARGAYSDSQGIGGPPYSSIAPAGAGAGASASSVALVAPSDGGSTNQLPPRPQHFPDPYDESDRTLTRSRSPFEDSTMSHAPSSVPDHVRREQKHSSMDSTSTHSSFPGGTKFHEEI